jgi:hypothetical protein
MILTEAIPKQYSVKACDKIVTWIDGKPERFDELMAIFFESNSRINQYSSSIMIHCLDKWAFLLTPYVEKMLLNLQRNDLHDAIKRNTLRILQTVAIPENMHGIATERCFGYLTAQYEPIAIKVFAMTIVYNLTKIYPELVPELQFILIEQLPFQSAGFKSRANKILVQLNNYKAQTV